MDVSAPRVLEPAPRERGRAAELVVRLFREKPLGAAGAVIFLVFLACGVFAGLLAPRGINEIDLVHRFTPPSLEFPLGTDRLGRDVLSRVLHGARISMIVGFVGAGLSTVISVAIGVVSGYLGGRIDLVTQRAVDAWMAFPDLVLLIVVVAVVGPGMPQIIVILGLLYGIARVAHRARCRGVGARAPVRARGAVDGRRNAAHPVAAHPAQRYASRPRAVHHSHRRRHPVGGRPLLPGAGHPAAGADLGQHALG